MENLIKFEQERINVELYMERLLDIKEECEYGTEKRKKYIDDGVRLVRELIKKVFDEGVLTGRMKEKVDMISVLSGVTKNMNDQLVFDYLNKDNDSDDIVTIFDSLIDGYGKDKSNIVA